MDSDAEGIMILDFSGVPMTPQETIAVFMAAVLYLQELHHGPMKFTRKDAEGVITGEGPYNWAGMSGEVFSIEFDENRWVDFFLPSRYEDTRVPESYVKLSRLRRTVPTFETAVKPRDKKKLH